MKHFLLILLFPAIAIAQITVTPPGGGGGGGTITLNAGTNTGYSAPGAMNTGSTYTFGATTDNLQFNGLGLGVAAPTTAGQISSTLGANNVTGFLMKRNTDTSPTGNFIDLKNAAAASLWTIDITGTLTSGSVPIARLSSSAVTLNTGTNFGMTTPGSVSLGASGNFGATTDNLRFNGLGLGVAAPTTAGQMSSTLGANNVTGQIIKRNTDTSPTGDFQIFQNAAGGALWDVDITGTLTAGTVPAGRLPGSFNGFANPTATVGTAAVNGAAATAMRSDAAPAINLGMAPTWTAAHAWKITDAATNTDTVVATLGHDSSGTPTTTFSESILFQLQDSTTADKNAGKLLFGWSTATDSLQTSYMDVMLELNGSANLSTSARFFGSGGLGVNSTTDPGAGYVGTKGLKLAGSTSGTTTLNPMAIAGTGTLTMPMQGNVMASNGVVTSTVDQTSASETAHVVYTVPANTCTAGTTFRLVAWGNMDNGTTAITFTPKIEWGGVGGVALLSTPTVVGTTTSQTNKTWYLVSTITIRTIGASGTAFCNVSVSNHTASSTGVYGQDEADSGTTGVTIDTTANKDLDLTWTLSATTGTPHVRTIAGWVEIVKN